MTAEAMYEDDNDIFPVFDIAELTADTEIVIEHKTIRSLGKIVAIADKRSSSINIEECVLTEVHINSAEIDIFINESVFREEIEFKHGVFNGKLGFRDSFFHEKADLSGAIFRQDVDFQDCIFHKDLTFFESAFEKKATFVSCDFKGATTFEGASFKGEVDLSESTFRKKGGFKKAIFHQAVDLSGTLFEESLEITDSNLPDRLHKKSGEATQSDLSHELDRLLERRISRRQVLRGLFRFLPEDKEE